MPKVCQWRYIASYTWQFAAERARKQLKIERKRLKFKNMFKQVKELKSNLKIQVILTRVDVFAKSKSRVTEISNTRRIKTELLTLTGRIMSPLDK